MTIEPSSGPSSCLFTAFVRIDLIWTGSRERWTEGRLDHEEDLDTYLSDLKGFLEIFDALLDALQGKNDSNTELAYHAKQLYLSVVAYVENIAKQVVEGGSLSASQGRCLAIGQGHHRLTAWKR